MENHSAATKSEVKSKCKRSLAQPPCLNSAKSLSQSTSKATLAAGQCSELAVSSSIEVRLAGKMDDRDFKVEAVGC